MSNVGGHAPALVKVRYERARLHVRQRFTVIARRAAPQHAYARQPQLAGKCYPLHPRGYRIAQKLSSALEHAFRKGSHSMGIEGEWYNELGSMLQISQSDSVISGTYHTAVGDAQGIYVLSGLINIDPAPGGQAVGWTVVWTNDFGTSHSVTTWSGQYQVVQGEEQILTFWLLTSEQLPNNDWQATNIGQDTFTRTQPAQEHILKARTQRARSHPTK